MKLSTIDTQILNYLSEGNTISETAQYFGYSPEGVRDRLHKLRQENKCRNTLQLCVVFHKERTKVEEPSY